MVPHDCDRASGYVSQQARPGGDSLVFFVILIVRVQISLWVQREVLTYPNRDRFDTVGRWTERDSTPVFDPLLPS